MIDCKLENIINVYSYSFILQDLCLSWQISEIQDTFKAFSNHLRRPTLSEAVARWLTSTSFSRHSVSFRFTLLQNEK